MAGINQGTPETAVGEPIRLGSNDEFEIEQHPASDKLIIRDTVNGKVAYVRQERGGQIGGDGVLIKALKQGKPMADDGRTYDTIRQAERAASSWVFVPPGTFNEAVEIDTDGLTLKGSGYGTLIDGGTVRGIGVNANNVTIKDLRVQSDASSNADGIRCVDGAIDDSSQLSIENVTITGTGEDGIDVSTGGCTIINCVVRDAGNRGIHINAARAVIVANTMVWRSGANNMPINTEGSIVANCTSVDATDDGIATTGSADNRIIIGNRVINAGRNGIDIQESNTIVANNRVSDSTNVDINDGGTGTLLDANLTGVAN